MARTKSRPNCQTNTLPGYEQLGLVGARYGLRLTGHALIDRAVDLDGFPRASFLVESRLGRGFVLQAGKDEKGR